MEKLYYVYMITNYTNSTLYIGVTNNLYRRLDEHKKKKTNGFTAHYNVYKLVYVESTPDIYAAIAREKQLKRWSRTKKDKLVNSQNPEWKDLMIEWNKN
ncbi:MULTISPECIES: GIY-YIG nuclease family protein [Anaerococcus]|uniref:GIY-YIG nuclease superfamily protein n=2 Tax=Anaerococcus octavius TaxID=54007 RepID=A0A380WZ01_9FIRM|nr:MULTISPECIES: GIY-YIG nuclease family protein [Anaerococcus]MDU4026265.1 GIY-YIG nuclease family protein [Anaerococcus sp.]MDU5535001.1 GIY-YIG nuclease family protein [Anaerococcus sp.]SUU93412.1 GIY-YIG nuclease superfamily protein [Anaerococcus octavius]